MRISEYEKKYTVAETETFVRDTELGTRGILARDLAQNLLKLVADSTFMLKIKINGLTTGATDFLGVNDAFMVSKLEAADNKYWNRKIYAKDLVLQCIDADTSPDNVWRRRNIWRGKNLGSSFTDDQKQSIANATFKGMFVGDYWTIGGKKWRIMDFDYWSNTGETRVPPHHVVVMPDFGLMSGSLNDSDITGLGYANTKYRREYQSNIIMPMIESAFGADYILSHRELLVNDQRDSGTPSSIAWYDSKADLPSECMVYGHLYYGIANSPSNVPILGDINRNQLAGFKIRPSASLFNHVSVRESSWLRDSSGYRSFATVDWTGNMWSFVDTAVAAFRPVFGIVGTPDNGIEGGGGAVV